MCDEEGWGERVQGHGHKRSLVTLSLMTVAGRCDWSQWRRVRLARRMADAQACTETMAIGRARTDCLRARTYLRKPWRQQCSQRRPARAAKRNSCSVRSMAAADRKSTRLNSSHANI